MKYLTKQEALEKIKTDPEFDFNSEEFKKVRNNKEVALAAVSLCPNVFPSLSDRLANDKEVALVAIQGDPRNIKHCWDLQGDKEVVLASVRQDPYWLDYASEEIRNAVGNNDPVAFLQSAIEKEKLEAKMAAKGIKINQERDNDVGFAL